MKPNNNPTLWERIEAFSIDDPTAGIKFSDKLAFQNGWTPAFTTKAVTEYKKFIFLCCLSPTGASPSKAVDDVWHLHLTYTQNYWKDFCGNTLQKEIHHHPSKGGAAEMDKHRNWYAETLALYKEVFDEEPPADVWPPATENTPVAPQPFNEPPAVDYTAAYTEYAYVLGLPFLFPLLLGKLHPFALKGPQFLLFYGLLLTAAASYFVLVRKSKQRIMQTVLATIGTTRANSFQVARYVFGKNKAVEAAVVDLVAKGILVAERREQFRFYPPKVDAVTHNENPLAASLLQNHSGNQPLLMKDLAGCYDENTTNHAGLTRMYQTVVKKDGGGFVVGALVLLLGVGRTVQGLHNGYPVGYLIALMTVGLFVLVAAGASLSSKKLLQEIFIGQYKKEEPALSGDERLLQKFVFLGVSVLAGTYAFANLENTFRRRATDDGSVSSGCGSSCGSSCGGGCGGCGGGD